MIKNSKPSKACISEKLTVFPELQSTVISSPLISTTTPSSQATSGSSTHTRDPTTTLAETLCTTFRIEEISVRASKSFVPYKARCTLKVRCTYYRGDFISNKNKRTWYKIRKKKEEGGGGDVKYTTHGI